MYVLANLVLIKKRTWTHGACCIAVHQVRASVAELVAASSLVESLGGMRSLAALDAAPQQQQAFFNGLESLLHVPAALSLDQLMREVRGYAFILLRCCPPSAPCLIPCPSLPCSGGVGVLWLVLLVRRTLRLRYGFDS